MNIVVKHTSNIVVKPTIILNFILDESGSMCGQRDSVISGFNEYIETMKPKTAEANYFVNLVKFGDKTEYVFLNKKIEDVRKITYKDYDPRFNTALRDAIGFTINMTERQMTESHPGASTIFYIFTDGQENASTEFSPLILKGMIESRERKGGWTFVFIGADASCLNQAHDWGIRLGNTITYNANNISGAINALSSATCAYTSNVSRGQLNTTTYFKDAGIDNSKKLDEQVWTPPKQSTTDGK